MAYTPSLPMINGTRFDYSSVKLRLNNKLYTGVHAIDYAPECVGSFIYGQSTPYPIGRTRGQLKTDSASIELYREEFGDIVNDIATIGQGGVFEAVFLITVAIGEPLSPLAGQSQVDTLIGARFQRFTVGWRQGPDALTVKLDFSFMNMLVNNTPLLAAQTIPFR